MNLTYLVCALPRKNAASKKRKIDEESAVYLVEKVVRVKRVKGVWKAVVKWQGYDKTTEEPFGNLFGQACE